MAIHSGVNSITLNEPLTIDLTESGEVYTSNSPGGSSPGNGITTVTGEATVTEVGVRDGQTFWKVTKTETNPETGNTSVRSAWINTNDVDMDSAMTPEQQTAYYAEFLDDETQQKLYETNPIEEMYSTLERQMYVNELSNQYGIGNGAGKDVKTSTGFKLFTYLPEDEVTALEDYIIKMTRIFGLPPQWAPAVDVRFQSNHYLVGRRYAETIMASPTVLSLCPGKIKYSEGFMDAAASTSKSDFISAVASGNADPFWKFEEVWQNGFGGGGYIDCVNVLCAFAVVCLSVGDVSDKTGGEGPLFKKRVPWKGGGEYLHINMLPLLEPDYGARDILGADGLGDLLSKINASASYVGNHFVHFNANGGMSVEDTFSTETRQSVIEQVVNGGISNAIKDVMYMASGTVGNAEVESDLESLKNMAISSLGGAVGSIMSAGLEIIHGGQISFPQVIDNCTWGRSFNFTVKFTSVYSDIESRFLHVIMPYLCLAAFFLPKQLKNKIDMYAAPPVVKAYARGVYACDCGVLTNVSVKRGGEDDSAWTASGQPMEIDVSFSITSLHTKLMQSDSKLWIIKNTGLQSYIGTLCGIDMTVPQKELMALTAKALTEGIWKDIRRNASYGLSRAINNGPFSKVLRSPWVQAGLDQIINGN